MDQLLSLVARYLRKISEINEKELTAAMVNNYVKQGIIPAPVKKKYNRCHISALLILCVLKSVLPLPEIKKLLRPKADTSESAMSLYSQFQKTATDIFSEINTKTIARGSNEEISDTVILESALKARGEQIAALSLLQQYQETKNPVS